MELQLYIQGFLICQLVVVSNISLSGANGKSKIVDFFIRTGSGIQNQRAAVQCQTSEFLTGSRRIGCANDLRIFCQRSGQLHRVAKYPFCQIVILYGKTFRFIRGANDFSNIAVIGLPGQFQIQIQVVLTLQHEGEQQILANLFPAFSGFLNKRCHLECIVPVTISFRKFNGHITVLSGLLKCAVTGCHIYLCDFHIFGICSGKCKFIF